MITSLPTCSWLKGDVDHRKYGKLSSMLTLLSRQFSLSLWINVKAAQSRQVKFMWYWCRTEQIFPHWGEDQAIDQESESFGGECRKNSTHTSKLQSKGKFIRKGAILPRQSESPLRDRQWVRGTKGDVERQWVGGWVFKELCLYVI